MSTHPLPKPITVTVDTTDGTAVGGSDYTTVSRTVTIPADTTFSFVFVPVLDDSISESDETFHRQCVPDGRERSRSRP